MTHGDTTGADATNNPEDDSTVDPGDGVVTTDPEDTVVPPEDTTTTEPDIEDDTVTPTCSALPLSGTLPVFTESGDAAWSSPATNLGVGGAGPDIATLTFNSNALGTFTLEGETPNDCTRCMVLVVDAGSASAKMFFAVDGAIEVNASPASTLDVTLSDVRLVEVNEGGQVVSGGACMTVGEVTLKASEQQCVPDCDGKVCGDNGCDGSCGSCNGGTTCNASGTACEGGQPPTCPTITISGLGAVQPGQFAADITASNIGTAETDFFAVEFYVGDTGTFNLGTGSNANYATCNQCLRIFEDAPESGDPVRQYFQTKGTLTVNASSSVDTDPPTLVSTISNVELHEVTIEEGTFTSTLVPNGKCYKLSNGALNSE